MDIHDRRDLLSVSVHEEAELDFVISLRGELDSGKPAVKCTVLIRYVPDQLVLDKDSFTRYLRDLPAAERREPERLAATLLSDLSNELVPRWVQVHLETGNLAVLVEDRQPNWVNDELLSRIKPL